MPPNRLLWGLQKFIRFNSSFASGSYRFHRRTDLIQDRNCSFSKRCQTHNLKSRDFFFVMVKFCLHVTDNRSADLTPISHGQYLLTAIQQQDQE